MAKQKYWDGTKWVQVAPSMGEFTTHLADDATTAKKGHVQLSDSVTSTSKVLASTAFATKAAMDRANAAFTSADNGKTAIKNAVIGVDSSVVIPPDPSFSDLATGIGQISTGKKWASGLGTVHTYLTVGNLDFKPSFIYVILNSPSFKSPETIYDINSYGVNMAWYRYWSSSDNLPKAFDGQEYVNLGGFKLRTQPDSMGVNWIAFE